jgi:hypothetical protein
MVRTNIGGDATVPPMLRLALSALLLAPVTACGDPGPLDGIPPECNPLGGAGCVTPWPSSAYLRDDPGSPTGVRLDLAPGAMPANRAGVELDVSPFNRRTGFSPAAQLFMVFGGAVDDTLLVFHDEIERSLTDSSPTVIVDMETGERVAHFAELDANAAAAQRLDEQALYLRPATRLAGGRRYAVGIRRSLTAVTGRPIAPTPGFQAILDRRPTGHERLEAIRERTEDAVGALASAGVPATDLLVAWDFVTADDASLLADTRAARDAAIAAMGELAADVAYEILGEESPTDDPAIARRVILSLSPPAVAGVDGLHRDASGTPIVRGTSATRAVLMIPACATAASPAGLLLFGHGFFGGIDEAQGGYMRRVARDLCMVVVGGVWRGMSSADVAFAADALNDANRALPFGERIVQGIVDFIALEQLARGRLATEVLVDGRGASIVDPARTYFYGISQGSILGTTFLAWDPHLTRGVLHVGGAGWGVLFERSTNWVTFKLILDGAYRGPLNHVIAQQIMQMAFDATDPAHVAQVAPDKQYLLHMSIGDAAVTNLATQLQARTLGLPVLGPALEVPYGLVETPGPLDNGLVIWTEDPSPLPPQTNATNAEPNEAHERLRRRAAVVEQIRRFFAEGQIVHTCDGPCDCAAGACGELDPP